MWGIDNWGEMIWGGASSPLPLMSPLGFLVLAVLLVVTGVVMQRRHAPQWAMWTLGAAVVVIPLAAYAGTVAIPNTFTNGTVADAGEVNANFDAVETAVNDNDGRITTAQDTADTAVTDAAAAQATADTCYSWGNHAAAGYVLQGQADSITSTMIGSGEVSYSDLQDGATLLEIADDDGAGSGLDADLLDGLHGAHLALAGHSHASTVTMGRIYLTNSGTILTTRLGSHELYWDKAADNLEIRNTNSDWLDFWWQSQKGTVMAGRSGAIGQDVTYVLTDLTSNDHGAEVHFGQADGEGGWCSVWLQYANGNLVGHYIKY